ncbi:hypothetical protein ES707_11331 [subsurface metagenome]
MKQEIYYFEEPGPKNTEQTINIAYRRAKEWSKALFFLINY